MHCALRVACVSAGLVVSKESKEKCKYIAQDCRTACQAVLLGSWSNVHDCIGLAKPDHGRPWQMGV